MRTNKILKKLKIKFDFIFTPDDLKKENHIRKLYLK